MGNVFRVLIIDDNPAIHQDFQKILLRNVDTSDLDKLDEQYFGKEKQFNSELAQLEISAVLQGQEGVARIHEALEVGKPYALAFVDIRMPPGWDGIETIKHIWDIDPTIQIVICTAYSDYSWEKTIEELGVKDNLLILKKPFDAIAARQLACALTKKWQLMRENSAHLNSIEQRIQKRTASLQKSLAQIKATLEASAEGILIVDSQGKITDYNKKFLELWNIPPKVLEHQELSTLLEYTLKQVSDPELYLAKINKIKAHNDLTDICIIKLNNSNIIEQYTQPYKLQSHTVGRVWSFRDITQRIHLEEKLEYEATHDSLTGLPNRVQLYADINQSIATASRNKSLLSILFFDLDRFKLINDSLGHGSGDALLRAIADRLKTNIRSTDTFARLGGDEFVILMTNLDNTNQIIDLVSKLFTILKTPFLISNREVVITASFGISIYPQDGQNTEKLLRNADIAMYQAKNMGADQYCFYKEEMNIKSMLRLELESDLRNAFKNNEFFIQYQPQFDILSHEIIAVEALIRWKHPKKGIILPMEFIPLAEEMGLIQPLGAWILETACKQNKAWQLQGHKPIRMAVNITTKQINQPNFVEYLKDLIEHTGLLPQYLELELTENVLINNAESLKMINAVRQLGIQIALDDFGTGTSSLSCLRKISINRLKIDKSFIDSIGDNQNDESLIKAIINMARSLNMEVLAEGVEHQHQITFLEDSECNEVQGYFLGKPLSNNDLELLLK